MATADEHERTSSDECREHAIEVLLQSIVEAGGSLSDNCEIRNGGIFAKDEIDDGHVILKVPFSQCISKESVQNSSLSRILEEYPALLDFEDELLAMALLHGKLFPSTSPWAKSVAVLPSQHELDLPIYWSPEQVEYLKGTTVYHLTHQMKRQIQSDWTSLIEPLATEFPTLLGGATHDLYKWALSMIYSRAVGFTRKQHEKEEKMHILFPLIDMANHAPAAAGILPEDDRFFEEARETFSYRNGDEGEYMTLTSTLNRTAGQEVYSNYGTYSNSKFLFSYGFVIPGQQTPRTLDVWPSLGVQTISGYETKIGLIQSHVLTREQTYDFKGSLRSPNFINPSLLAQVRVLQATPEELRNGIMHAFCGKMVSERNEAATLACIRGLLKGRIQPEIVNSVHTELAKLEANEGEAIPSNHRLYMALILRSEEISLMEEIVVYIDQLNEQLRIEGPTYQCPDYTKLKE
jgi:hypothetical protein